MDKSNEKIMVLAGLGLAAFVVYKVIKGVDSVAEGLGLKDSADTKDLNSVTENPNSPWSPNFYKAAPAGAVLLTSSGAVALADKLWNMFGVWDDDEAGAIAIIKSMKTQSQLSYLADVFYESYRKDLLSWLRGTTYPYDGLSDEDVNALNNYVNKLPKYKL
jgi:hypothetical protein